MDEPLIESPGSAGARSNAERCGGLIDLRDHRGRLVRLIAAVAIGIVAAVITMLGVLSVAAEPEADPVSGASVGVFAIALVVFASLLAHWTIGFAARRLRR